MSIMAEVMQLHLDKSYKEGSAIDLIIGVPKDLSVAELSQLQANIASQGVEILAPMEMGSTEEWANAVRMKLRNRPIKKGEVGILPLAVLIIGALGAVGVSSFLGWKVGDALKKNWLPTVLIGVGGLILLAWVLRPAIPETVRAARGG